MADVAGISAADGGAPAETEDLSAIFPLPLRRTQLIPSAPNRRRSAIDWIHDFGGLSWLAYGADSLLVISHFPSPLTEPETLVGPSFRQVIEPPSAGDGDVINGVRWCPVCPSEGEVAAAGGNRVWLYRPDPRSDSGSFCWRQTAGFVQNFAVESIEWTGSGDGLIVAGIEVALWIRKDTSWEMAWKSRTEVPQDLVSATWFSEGLVATAAYLSVNFDATNVNIHSRLPKEEITRVSVYYNDKKYGIQIVHLYHPQPITYIQWRPSTVTHSKQDASQSWRDVLMTCCLDGTVRMWSEVENGRGRKHGKDIQDQKGTRKCFHVVAVIEINQILKGILDTDIFIAWTIETGGIVSKFEGENYCLTSTGSKHDLVGNCEWLISVGPSCSVVFWAIHCLDDTNPLRLPRVTLWKTQDVIYLKECHPVFDYKDQSVFLKSVSLRNRPFGPPVACSLLQLLADNSVSWLQLYSPPLNGTDDRSLIQTSKEKSLSCFADSVLGQDGHTGIILQLDVHPYSCEVELAVSLDSNGLVFFWSLPAVLNCTLGMQTCPHPEWELLAKITSQDLSTGLKYSRLRWAPSVLDEHRFLLLGYANGIDCFVIKASGKRDNVFCHKVLTIPFAGNNCGEGPPDHIFTTPLASTCGQSFVSNGFLLIGIWMKKFKALSWKVMLHSKDPSGTNCGCSDAKFVATSEKREYVSSFEGKTFYGTFYLGPSVFPDQQGSEQVTGVAVAPPNNLMPSIQQCMSSYTGFSSNSLGYQMATGCSDGTVKLWKTSLAESVPCSKVEVPTWELVGMFTAHQGPVSAVSLSSCGNKIATVSRDDKNGTANLHIWESICLINGGSFLLEDAVILDGAVVALNWLSLGNGHLLLGVCMPNELRIYSEKSCNQFLANTNKSNDAHIWCCIALFHTQIVSNDFLWGPKLTPVLIHKKHITLFSQWLHVAEQKGNEDRAVTYIVRTDETLACAVYVENGICDTGDSSKYENNRNDQNICNFCLMFHKQCDYDIRSRMHSLLDIADKLCSSLAVYHPEALMQYLYSGNWKRAYAVIKYLVGSIKANEASAKVSRSSKFGKSHYRIPEIDFSRYYGVVAPAESSSKGLQWGQDVALGSSSSRFQQNIFQIGEDISKANAPYSFSTATSQKSEIMAFIDTLEKSHEMIALTNDEITQILAVVDLLGELSESVYASTYESLDEPGRRFWVGVQFRRWYFLRKFGRSAAPEKLVVKSGLVSWAFQSDCQDNLLDSLLSAEPSWLEMRSLGVGFWFINASQLRKRMEKLARLQYLKNKDPKDCALLYLALNRLQVLAGLFKISKDEKDKPLVGFLSRNFQEEKNKAAALKNAYILMGRHQLELAIAFFLLGGDSSSAITLCAKNLGDEQLALVICRLIDGYGGPLERHLISNLLLPNAIEKGDYWLSSLFEWMLGNYSSSISKLFDSHLDQNNNNTALCNRLAFLVPDIGQYCVMLAAKNGLKNSIGDYLAMVLSKLAASMAASALKRRGLPLEAMECYSSSASIEDHGRGNFLDVGNHVIFHEIMTTSSGSACNWLQVGVACHLESNVKLNIAMQYISKFLRDHLSWPHSYIAPSEKLIIHEEQYIRHDEVLIEECKCNLDVIMSTFEQKYSMVSLDLCNMVLLFTCYKESLYHGFRLLQGDGSDKHQFGYHSAGSFILIPALPSLLMKATKEISYIFSRHVVSCNLTDSTLELLCGRSFTFQKDGHSHFYHRIFCLRSVIQSLRTIREFLKLYDAKCHTEGLTLRISSVLDFLEYSIYLASTWLVGNVKGLILMTQTILNASVSDQSSIEGIAGDLKKVLHQTLEVIGDASSDGMETVTGGNCREAKQSDSSNLPLLEDDMWEMIVACLWLRISSFVKDKLGKFLETGRTEDESRIADPMSQFPYFAAKLLITSITYISSLLIRQLASFLRQKASKGLPVTAFIWLNESSQHQTRSLHHFLSQGVGSLELTSNEDRESLLKRLWEISFRPEEICENFVSERVNSFSCNSRKFPSSWEDMQRAVLAEYENGGSLKNRTEGGSSSNSSTKEAGSLFSKKIMDTDALLEVKKKAGGFQCDVSFFHSPKEVLKRSGELLEAICFNSTDEQQVAVSSNKKGILFFNWKTEQHFREQAEYIWSESDWPQDGWARYESTPVPTYVSPGIGLGSKRGSHLGLGGATIGLGSLARPGRDLTGGGAFGIPGYAGIGASGLGWGEQEDFEEFVDPPATIENISSRALSHHPSRPFFLVGSTNTHIYLWEFGKDRATATYGVLPAANVPPPYALASVSALQFDHCGQRFASAALDGTVCTWQLEVGGRSNVHPTESALCFNNHASDVAYISASGSILAAAGCSTNGANIVLWDTLAPPLTSQASLVCHEGGARSLSIFDNDIGTGSVSPLIATGGKSGDVGLHDFRFIATGKTKRHKHDISNHGDNVNGMIWYIPKAHLGSVTKISTIPNTSLFLTGSKDGDVKLWDAKRSQMVFHWQKMHDRHTFLQPNSRSIGGVVRAAVTDIQAFSHGFLTCGGDGSVKIVQFK